jgi:hypothetical protein
MREICTSGLTRGSISVWDAYLAACELAGLQLRVERNIVLLSKAKPPEVPEAPPILTGPRFDSKIERDMEAIIIPEVRSVMADLAAVLDYLYRQASERNPEAFPRVHPQDAASGEKEKYVTVFGIPPKFPDRQEPKISMELFQSSVLDIFHLSLHLSGLSYRVVDNRIELFETR